jgi:hypothetical protein
MGRSNVGLLLLVAYFVSFRPCWLLKAAFFCVSGELSNIMSEPTTFKVPQAVLEIEDAPEFKQSSTEETNFTGHGPTQKVVKSEEEKRLVLKLDLVFVPLAALIYFVAYLDRNSIGNARLMGLEKDLDMTPNQYYNCLASPPLYPSRMLDMG